MTMTVTLEDRSFSTDMLEDLIKIPIERQYVAHLITDDADAKVTFDGDVQFQSGTDGGFVVQEWDEDTGDSHGPTWTVALDDVRSIEFY